MKWIIVTRTRTVCSTSMNPATGVSARMDSAVMGSHVLTLERVGYHGYCGYQGILLWLL